MKHFNKNKLISNKPTSSENWEWIETEIVIRNKNYHEKQMKFAKMFAILILVHMRWSRGKKLSKLSNALSLIQSPTHTQHAHKHAKTWSSHVWCRNWRFPWHPFSNPADLIRNLIPPCEATLRDHPTDLTPLHAALSMLSPFAHGNQTGNKAWALGEGGGEHHGSHCGCNTGPSGTLSGKGPVRPKPIDSYRQRR